MMGLISGSVFNKADAGVIKLLRDRISERKPSLLMPGMYVSSEVAQFGCLLNYIFNFKKLDDYQHEYKAYVANSRLEALHGAIKMARHYMHFKFKHNTPRNQIAFYDRNHYFQNLFNPLKSDVGMALIPYVFFNNNLAAIDNMLVAETLCAAIFVVDDALDMISLKDTIEKFRNKHVPVIVDYSNMKIKSLPELCQIIESDIIVIGESLSNFQVPIGAFCMTNDIFSPWNKLKNCGLHSSTYGGNLAAVSIANAYLKTTYADLLIPIESDLNEIACNADFKLASFSRYINPVTVKFTKMIGYDLSIDEAYEGKLKISDDYYLDDYIACAGCNIRGYNSLDMIEDVLDVHHDDENYWAQFSQKLFDLTGFQHAFPGVSGASAVEMGITLGFLANHRKTTLLTFDGNYAGKTLIALNATAMDHIKIDFLPLYFDVVVVDPFSDNAEIELIKVLSSGKVSLLWFELLRGQDDLLIPSRLIDIINENKEKYGYLIGVDEILVGNYRTGPYLCSQHCIGSPDIVTLSKGISDGVFPLSVTLVADQVYDNARMTNPDLVSYIERHYINQLGSHFGLNVLNKLQEHNISAHVLKISSILDEKLNKSIKGCPYINAIVVRGLSISIKFNLKCFWVNLVGKGLFSMFFAAEFIRNEKVLIYFDRLFPPLNLTEKQADVLAKQFSSMVNNCSAFSIVLRGVMKGIKSYWF